jgi:hypothetical protein
MPKLFSECRKISQEECLLKPECIYTNGKKYQYCRLSSQYVLDKETKKPVLKTFKNKTRKNLTMKNKPISIKRIENPPPLNADEIAANRISKFIRNTKFRRTARYLSKICADSGICLAFGTEQRKIKDFFGGFSGFEFVKPPIQRIGNPSANGFVHEIHYHREKYDAYAVLKSSAKISADNLYYEYLIGKQLNSLLSVVPTFVETYGIYKYKTGAHWKHTKDTHAIQENVLVSGLENMTPLSYAQNLATSCTKSKYLAILIQHLKRVFSVKQMMEHKVSNIRTSFIHYELPYVLFQIYFVLDMLKSDFTHYDLHWSNVLLYVPLDNTHYIHYHYHTKQGKIISFKSMYMAKIIDYGRCYVDNLSKKIRKDLCADPSCTDPHDSWVHCGEEMGYKWLNNRRIDTNKDFIYSQKQNQSHDLRLLNMVKDYVKTENSLLYDLVFRKIVYSDYYGTEEKIQSGLPNKIHNVSDAIKMLEKYVEMSDIKRLNNDVYDIGYDKLGDLHIHADFSDMRFIPSKSL